MLGEGILLPRHILRNGNFLLPSIVYIVGVPGRMEQWEGAAERLKDAAMSSLRFPCRAAGEEEKIMELARLSDDEVTEGLAAAVREERLSRVKVMEFLVEFDRRDLSSRKGYSSLFRYCTEVLGYSEDSAYKRMQVSRAARRFPSIISRLRDGRLTLNAVVLLGPHLTSENHRRLLDWALGKRRRDIEMKIAGLAPKPEPGEVIRSLSQGTSETVSALPSGCNGVLNPALPISQALFPAVARENGSRGPAINSSLPGQGPKPIMGTGLPAFPAGPRIEILTPERVRFAFTGSKEFLGKVDRLKQLLWHKCPSGRLEDLFEEVVDFYLQRRDPEMRRRPAARRPIMTGRLNGRRRIPQWVKDLVWKRDGGRCVYVSTEGKRCGERGGIECDHVQPWALGGKSDDPGNIRLLCRTHNQLAARQVFGDHRSQRSAA